MKILEKIRNFRKVLIEKLRKLLSLRASPQQIAIGFAVGVFIGIFPTFGLGGLLILALAPLFRFNIPASIVGTLAGNPLFAPLWIYLSCFVSGIKFREFKVPDESLRMILGHYSKIGGQYLLGNMVVSFVVAAISYVVIVRLVTLYQRRRARTQQILLSHTDVPHNDSLRPAVFLDRDGTIMEDRGHVSQLDQVEIFPFAAEALQMLRKKYLLFIVTNQSSVGLGKISLEDATKINNHVVETLKENGIAIQQVYCCSHKRDDNCNCIKPKSFFIREAERVYNIDVASSFTIGDHPHDVDFGNNAGARGLYVLTGHGAKHRGDIAPGTLVFDNLLEAAKWILNKKGSGD